MVVNLKYTAAIALGSNNPTGTLCGTAVTWQPSSTFTPYVTQTTQPYGRDQMATLYGKYKVLGFKISLDCNASGTATPEIVQILAQSPTGAIDLAGVSGSLSAARPNVTTIFPAGFARTHYERTFKMHELLGITKSEFDADVEDYAAAVGSDPAQMPTLKFYLSTTTSGTPTSLGVLVTLYQRVQFFGRIGQALS